MRLDPKVLNDLALRFDPRDYLRVTPTAHSKTPLGTGYGDTRFASPRKTFKLLYMAANLETAIAETIVRDRFQGKARRELTQDEAQGWGVTQISAKTPLILIDLRTTGLLRLGVSTNAARAKTQDQGRKLSQAIYDGTDLDGLLYMSRLTGMACVAVYDRAVAAKLTATPVEEIVTLSAFVPALQRLNLRLIRA